MLLLWMWRHYECPKRRQRRSIVLHCLAYKEERNACVVHFCVTRCYAWDYHCLFLNSVQGLLDNVTNTSWNKQHGVPGFWLLLYCLADNVEIKPSARNGLSYLRFQFFQETRVTDFLFAVFFLAFHERIFTSVMVPLTWNTAPRTPYAQYSYHWLHV
jgi:hypothetical protein